MSFDDEILAKSVSKCRENWSEACKRFSKPNESYFTLAVVEPILVALGWPRISSRDLLGTGSFFEWPAKDTADFALLIKGWPFAVGEIREKLDGADKGLGKSLLEYRAGEPSYWGIAIGYERDLEVWLYDLCQFRTHADLASELRSACPITREGFAPAGKLLERLARPVLGDRCSSAGEAPVSKLLAD